MKRVDLTRALSTVGAVRKAAPSLWDGVLLADNEEEAVAVVIDGWGGVTMSPLPPSPALRKLPTHVLFWEREGAQYIGDDTQHITITRKGDPPDRRAIIGKTATVSADMLGEAVKAATVRKYGKGETPGALATVLLQDGAALSCDAHRLTVTPLDVEGDPVQILPSVAMKRFLTLHKGETVTITTGTGCAMVAAGMSYVWQSIPEEAYPPLGDIMAQQQRAQKRAAVMQRADLAAALRWAMAIHGTNNGSYPVRLCPAGHTMIIHGADPFNGDAMGRVPIQSLAKPTRTIAVNAKKLLDALPEEETVAIGWETPSTPLTIGDTAILMPLNFDK